ncbi:YidB family protein [Acetobacter oeni]|uniref:DUF937 domain-containing protein n=1 Tax=Acetobacter oeni TaxID=304077 RepID=A0A511XL72_9PROT|nr:YidB family protein [Acetobacter oeni]MBB3883908.1 uncharacterized protein YidB (DUF937 family) [Acetobacter oeni]NHO19915.1 hypothetical protein [Acetobacter oeni]GBR02622.1 hypothetical protein AA21952_0812 [Acetobacter oeni LMG 21952]GEN63710.1 hypothetical protein AOE01nite_19340 [Acetobacter oeni]
MTASREDNLPTGLNTVADFLTGAPTDHSGIASAVSEYAGKENAPGIPEIRRRAHEAGLDGVLLGWRQEISKQPADETVIKKLIPEDIIQKISKETGVSVPATVTGLAQVLPGIVYRNAQREHQPRNR